MNLYPVDLRNGLVVGIQEEHATFGG